MIAVDMYDIILEKHNSVCSEILIKEFDTLFDYTSQEGTKPKLLNITIIQVEHGVIIKQTYHIINNIIQNIWG